MTGASTFSVRVSGKGTKQLREGEYGCFPRAERLLRIVTSP